MCVLECACVCVCLGCIIIFERKVEMMRQSENALNDAFRQTCIGFAFFRSEEKAKLCEENALGFLRIENFHFAIQLSTIYLIYRIYASHFPISVSFYLSLIVHIMRSPVYLFCSYLSVRIGVSSFMLLTVGDLK